MVLNGECGKSRCRLLNVRNIREERCEERNTNILFFLNPATLHFRVNKHIQLVERHIVFHVVLIKNISPMQEPSFLIKTHSPVKWQSIKYNLSVWINHPAHDDVMTCFCPQLGDSTKASSACFYLQPNWQEHMASSQAAGSACCQICGNRTDSLIPIGRRSMAHLHKAMDVTCAP